MANALYPKFKEYMLSRAMSAATLAAGTLSWVLVDSADETYNAADEFYGDITSAGRVGTPTALTSLTYTNGVLDAADANMTGVTGDQSEAIVIFFNTGTPATSRLVAWLDTGITNLPVTPNGGDILAQWNASGIFAV